MKSFAVFDIDGTLVRWQLYHTVVDKLAKQGALGAQAHRKLHEARMAWKRREGADAFHEYEMVLIQVFESAVVSINPAQFDALVEEVIDEYKDQVYTYTRDLIAELKAKDYVLLAISGSHEELVARMATHYGFDDYVGSRYERINGSFSGQAMIASLDKQMILRDLVAKHQLDYAGSYAVGDSLSDAAMLELVEYPIAFNPDQRLYAAARRHGWPIVVERKNVVYRLDSTSDHYQLK